MATRALVIAAIVTTVAQIGMVLLGHQVVAARAFFGPGGMLISLAAGVLLAYLAKGTWQTTLFGGALAGGLCALIGIGISYLLGDVPVTLLLFGTVASAVAGSVGAATMKVIAGFGRAT